MNQDTVSQDRALTVNLLLEPIKAILDRPEVTEITINQPKELWYKGFDGWQKHTIDVFDEKKLKSLITAIFAFNSQSETPIGSLLMPDGSRCQVVRYPAVLDGQISFTVRKHSTAAFSLQELKDYGAFDGWEDRSFNTSWLNTTVHLTEKDKELMDLKAGGDIIGFLSKAVQYHKNIVIAGKTGSGKTTFAKALITQISSDERIITIEDVHELHLPNHPNHLHMMFGGGKGRVSAFEALMACMRLSPDRILLAELRGAETWEYLMSLNTGHPGGITTVHANSAVHTFSRIANLVKSSEVGRTVDLEAIKSLLYSTVDVVLYFDQRRLKEVFFDPIYVEQILG